VTPPAGRTHHPSHDSAFLRACRREEVRYTPIWLMRQAGRYMKEYRELRAHTSFLDLCKSPALVAEVTSFAADRTGVDAAILFSDLLLPVEAMGLRLAYDEGEGPTITPAVRDAASVDSLQEVDPDALSYVYEGVRRTRADLPVGLPLIGFAGAPFTLASYLIEGGASRHFAQTKTLMYRDEGAWTALMEKVVRAQAGFLTRQIRAGAQAVQLFDSWAGCLSPADYRRYVQPHTAALIRGLPAGVPVIHFATGTAGLLRDMRAAGGTVIGFDWRVELDAAWDAVGHDAAVMGNLDPAVLLGDEATIRENARRILDQAAGRPGHVFNLGHGVLPETPEMNVSVLVEAVHELSRR